MKQAQGNSKSTKSNSESNKTESPLQLNSGSKRVKAIQHSKMEKLMKDCKRDFQRAGTYAMRATDSGIELLRCYRNELTQEMKKKINIQDLIPAKLKKAS